MRGESLGRPKDFLLQRLPARLSDLSPRRIGSTGHFNHPLPTGSNDLPRGHITGLDVADHNDLIAQSGDDFDHYLGQFIHRHILATRSSP